MLPVETDPHQAVIDMNKPRLISVSLFLIGVVVVAILFVEQDRPEGSYGERKKYKCERAHLQVASDIFWMLAPFMQTPEEERRKGAFITLEAQLQLNIVRLQYLIETDQIKLSEVRAIAEQTLRDVRSAVKKRKMYFRIWTDSNKSYDLGTNEVFLPRYYPLAKELIKIVGEGNFELDQ